MSGASAMIETVNFAGIGDPGYLLGAPGPDAAPFYETLSKGELFFRYCLSCGTPRQPPAPVCPYCGADGWQWRSCSPEGSVHSWTRYHRSYVKELEPVLPYSVLSVQLDDGPRLIGRLVDAVQPSIGMRVRTVVERWPGGQTVAAFTAAPPTKAAGSSPARQGGRQ